MIGWLWLSLAAAANTIAPVSATTLAGARVELPASMPAERTVLVLGFKQSHNTAFDAWRPHLSEMSRDPAVDWLELPYVDVPRILQGFIGGAMNRTIRDDVTRAHFAPVWDSSVAMREALDIRGESSVVLVLCDRSGRVEVRIDGLPTSESVAALRVAALSTEPQLESSSNVAAPPG